MANRGVLASGAALVVLVLGVVAFWQTGGGGAPRRVLTREPQGVMGTSCQLIAIAAPDEPERAPLALAGAEAELRRIEALMSTWIEASELSRFNAAEAGEEIALSPDTLVVLRSARAEHARTDGTFDVTCRPLIELWRDAGKSGVMPVDAAISAARGASSWADIDLRDTSAIKSRGTARVDVGGNAKGYAIDLAVRAMQAAGARGGLVDVGGDLRFFGEAPDGVAWTIDIRHPDGRSVYRSLALTGDRAVCTSGNYARFAEIGGRRFSHIIDPRSGWPADATPSVTVIGPDTLTVDTWATALSVLGPEGLARLPENLDALILTLAEDGTIVEHRSPGFPQP